jgi:hypothetical protein
VVRQSLSPVRAINPDQHLRAALALGDKASFASSDPAVFGW